VVRRKKKAVHKTAGTDDKRLQSTLKRLGVTALPGIEEVNLFKEDGSVIHFDKPKVQVSTGANTYVVSGNSETKKLQDLLPGILNQLGSDNIANLKKLAETLGKVQEQGEKKAKEEEEIPTLVESFEAAAEKK